MCVCCVCVCGGGVAHWQEGMYQMISAHDWEKGGKAAARRRRGGRVTLQKKAPGVKTKAGQKPLHMILCMHDPGGAN